MLAIKVLNNSFISSYYLKKKINNRNQDKFILKIAFDQSYLFKIKVLISYYF